MAKSMIPVTVSAGQALSASGNLTANVLEAILLPSDLDGDDSGRINISFQISDDNVTFFDLFDYQGREMLRSAVAGCALDVDASVTQAVMYIKIRFGSRDWPITQAADRVIKLIVS
jgi:hypothetical protein